MLETAQRFLEWHMHDDPITAFRAAVDLLNAENWRAVADLCDAGSLAGFKRQVVESLDPNRPPALSLEEFTDTDDKSADEIASELEEYSRITDATSRLREELPGTRSFAELRDLEPAIVFARWLDGESPRAQLRELARTGDIDAEVLERLSTRELMAWQVTPLHAVYDGEDVAYVVYKFLSSDPIDKTETTLRQLGASAEEQDMYRRLAGRRPARVITCLRGRDGAWRLMAGYALFADIRELGWTYA